MSSITRLAILSLFVAIILGQESLVAEEDAMVDRGRELFEREWKFEEPDVLEQDATESQFTFARRLMQLPGDGLGPMHNAVSCESCHASGGGAGVDRNVTLLTLDPRTFSAFKSNRKEVRSHLIDLYPGLLSPRGFLSMETVIHEKSTRPFYKEMRENIEAHIPGERNDDWLDSKKRTIEAIAENPVLAGRDGPLDFYLSQRNSPPLYGLGLIDGIDMSRLGNIARSQARRTNGRVTGRVGAGKFGWRGQTSTLADFVRGACANELGLQVARGVQPPDAADETYVSLGMDLDETEVGELIAFVRALPAPIQETRLQEERLDTREGKKVFNKIGCNVCHVERLGPARGLYSDLLLHDMGDLLQAPSPASIGENLTRIRRVSSGFFPPEKPPIGSQFMPFPSSPKGGYFGSGSGFAGSPMPYPMERPREPTFPAGKLPAELTDVREPSQVTWDALQREWKTPPLWGVADSAPYLHDGRAATLDAAIRWHAGEAADAAAGYRGLDGESRRQLIAFLASLRAPVNHKRQEVDRSFQPRYVRANEVAVPTLEELAEDLSVFDPES